ncbi:MAG: CPA2 family monovalent cation:H+ antiporter-2 [Planctomycetota bacterium]|jgi:CPA2 family monovalent cation:H+ antiporter-2
MHIDPLLPTVTAIMFVVVIVGLVLRKLRQPSLIGYLLTGVLLGPFGMRVITAEEPLQRLGGFGVILLLFFVGMEVSPKKIVQGLKASVLGTAAQVMASIACVWAIGTFLGWPTGRIVLLGFVVSLSSTAVVIRLLKDQNEMESKIGNDVLGILLVQDIAIIPMIVVLGLLGGVSPDGTILLKQFVGSLLIVTVIVFLAKRDSINLGMSRLVGDDREMQVFVSILVCLGLSFLTAILELSTALGAFVAGVVISSARETKWIHESLEPFRVVFLAVFFVSVGMLLDLKFLQSHWQTVGLLSAVILVSNTFINAIILRLSGSGWYQSLRGGALLAPIGELSFVLAAIGASIRLIEDFAYQATLSLIAVTLTLGPFWNAAINKATKRTRTVSGQSE